LKVLDILGFVRMLGRGKMVPGTNLKKDQSDTNEMSLQPESDSLAIFERLGAQGQRAPLKKYTRGKKLWSTIFPLLYPANY